MKRKLYLLFITGCLTAGILMTGCGSDSENLNSEAEFSVTLNEDTGTEESASSESASDEDASGNDSEDSSGDASSGNTESEDTSDDTESEDADASDTISDEELKETFSSMIDDISQNQASSAIEEEPKVSVTDGEITIYIRSPEAKDLPIYAEAICSYYLEAEEKYDDISIDYLYFKCYETAEEGYVEEGTLISWVTQNAEDGTFMDDTTGIYYTDFTVEDLMEYFGLATT